MSSHESDQIAQKVVLAGIKYVRGLIRDLTKHILSKQVSSKDIALSIQRDLRTTLATPAIYTALKVMHRCNEYIAIAYEAELYETPVKFPPSKTEVDHTIKVMVRDWIKTINQTTRIDKEWEDPQWNPLQDVNKALTRIIDHNSRAFFGIGITFEDSETD